MLASDDSCLPPLCATDPSLAADDPACCETAPVCKWFPDTYIATCTECLRPVCQWDETLYSDDSYAIEQDWPGTSKTPCADAEPACEWDASIKASNSQCFEHCSITNLTNLAASDTACVPWCTVTGNESLPSTDPGCVDWCPFSGLTNLPITDAGCVQPGVCKWNGTLSDTDPLCVEPCAIVGLENLLATDPQCFEHCAVTGLGDLAASSPDCVEPLIPALVTVTGEPYNYAAQAAASLTPTTVPSSATRYASAGERFLFPLEVTVTDANNVPVPNVTIYYSITATTAQTLGDETASNGTKFATAVTDPNGRAAVYGWAGAGTNSAAAYADLCASEPAAGTRCKTADRISYVSFTLSSFPVTTEVTAVTGTECPEPTPPIPLVSADQALVMLNELRQAPLNNVPAYSRDYFNIPFPTWPDYSGYVDASGTLVDASGTAIPEDGTALGTARTFSQPNGRNDRDDILARDLHNVILYPPGSASTACTVYYGWLVEPYGFGWEYGTGTYETFRRGSWPFGTGPATTTLSPRPLFSSDPDIEHMVALGNAWKSGANTWLLADGSMDTEKLEKFATDPLELTVADGDLNVWKSDKSAGEWLPIAENYQCEYVIRQIMIKHKWDLAVDNTTVVTQPSSPVKGDVWGKTEYGQMLDVLTNVCPSNPPAARQVVGPTFTLADDAAELIDTGETVSTTDIWWGTLAVTLVTLLTGWGLITVMCRRADSLSQTGG